MASKKRSLLKAVTWRVAGSFATVLAVLALTKDISISLSAGTADMIVKIIAYYVHERVWDKIDFGRQTKIISEEFSDGAGGMSLDKIIAEALRLKAIEESLPKKGEDQNGQ